MRRQILSSQEVAGISSDSGGVEAIYSRFGISGVLCDGKLILMPRPSAIEDEGSQPFNGRMGRLRYLALAVMAAAGAVAADLVQLVLPFPQQETPEISETDMDVERPERAPVAYPILLGHVLTHVVAAMCASCGRARARSDSLELVWPVPFSTRGSFAFSDSGLGVGKKCVDSVAADCEGFLKLGLLARILQVVLAKMGASSWNSEHVAAVLNALRPAIANLDDTKPLIERNWVQSCFALLEAAVGNSSRLEINTPYSIPKPAFILNAFHDACVIAAGAACSFLADACTIFQVVVPGVMSRYESRSFDETTMGMESGASLQTLQKLLTLFNFESVDEMLKSSAVQETVASWFDTACAQIKAASSASAYTSVLDSNIAIRGRLFRTQGFRSHDWPLESLLDQSKHRHGEALLSKESSNTSMSKMSFKVAASAEPQDESTSMQIEAIHSPRNENSASDLLRQQTAPSLMSATKKTVSLIGEYRSESPIKTTVRPRITVIPTSYTDLYAELGVLLPDCEQSKSFQ